MCREMQSLNMFLLRLATTHIPSINPCSTTCSVVYNSNMSVISFAVIGKNRQPIYMKEFTSEKSSKDTDDDTQLFGIAPSSSSPTNVVSSSSFNQDGGRCDCSIRQQFIIHDALDYMEQWIESQNTKTLQQQQQQNAHAAMFAGLLCPIEDMRVYGKTQ